MARISKMKLMFDYMFETDVYNMKIKGDEHIYMMGINLERIYLYRGIPCNFFLLHNKAYTFGMKILGHTGLTIVLL